MENIETKRQTVATLNFMEQEPFDQNSLKRYGLKNEDVLELLKEVFK